MSLQRIVACITSLGLVAWITFACGGSHNLQSITVMPVSADAQNYPNGEVPFVATGHYNSSPMTVTPLQSNWGAALFRIENGTEVPTNGAVSVDTNGMARCNANASGTYSIAASVPLPHSGPPPPCPMPMYSNMASCPNVTGTAQLTCP